MADNKQQTPRDLAVIVLAGVFFLGVLAVFFYFAAAGAVQ